MSLPMDPPVSNEEAPPPPEPTPAPPQKFQIKHHSKAKPPPLPPPQISDDEDDEDLDVFDGLEGPSEDEEEEDFTPPPPKPKPKPKQAVNPEIQAFIDKKKHKRVSFQPDSLKAITENLEIVRRLANVKYRPRDQLTMDDYLTWYALDTGRIVLSPPLLSLLRPESISLGQGATPKPCARPGADLSYPDRESPLAGPQPTLQSPSPQPLQPMPSTSRQPTCLSSQGPVVGSGGRCIPGLFSLSGRV